MSTKPIWNAGSVSYWQKEFEKTNRPYLSGSLIYIHRRFGLLFG